MKLLVSVMLDVDRYYRMERLLFIGHVLMVIWM